MNFEYYKPLALRTVKSLGNENSDLMHMAAGISGESGEVLDIIKKTFAYSKPLDRAHLIEEIGDAMFYVNGLLELIGVEMSEVLEKNIAKLEARYPDLRFDADKAVNRDKVAEQEAMSKVA